MITFLFFGFWLCALGIVFIIYFYSLNKKNKPLLNKFFQFADKNAKTVWKNVIINCMDGIGYKTRVRPNNKCDIYLFDNYFVIIRKTTFYTTAPVFITSDVEQTKKITGFTDIYKPNKISFFHIKQKEISIEIETIVYKEFLIGGANLARNSKYFSTTISFKHLTEEQITYLKQIKDWCSEKNGVQRAVKRQASEMMQRSINIKTN